MPELGKATYFLELNSAEFDAGLEGAEARANAATGNIAKSFGMVDGAVAQTAVVMGESAAAQTVATGEMAAGAARAAKANSAAASQSALSWNKAATSIKERGKLLHGFGSLAAGAAVFEFFRKGAEEMKAVNAQAGIVEAHIKSTGAIAGVTEHHVDALADKWGKLEGKEHDASMAADGILLTFPKIRNVVGKNNDIFDQADTSVHNLARTFHLDLSKAAVLVGKALNDPVKGMTALRRIGVSLTQEQTDAVKKMIEQGHVMQAQKLILKELQVETGGTAKAYGKTLAGQLDISKVKFETSAQTILTAFLPALVGVTQHIAGLASVFSGHAKLLRILIEVWVAYKLTMFAARHAIMLVENVMGIAKGTAKAYTFVMGKLAVSTEIAKDEQLALATAEGEAALAAEGGAAKSMLFSRSLMGKAGIAGAAVLAGYALSKLIRMIPGWDNAFKKFGATLDNVAAKLHLAGSGPSAAEMTATFGKGVQKQLATAYKTLLAQFKKNKTPKWAQKKIGDAFIKATVGEGYTMHDAEIFYNNQLKQKAGKDHGVTEGGAKSPDTPPPKHSGMPNLKDVILSPNLSIRESKAAMTKTQADDRAAYVAEQAFWRYVLKKYKTTAAQRAQIWSNISSAQQSIDQIDSAAQAKIDEQHAKAKQKAEQEKRARAKREREAEAARKKAHDKFFQIETPKIRIATAKAGQTAGLKDDIAAYGMELKRLDYLKRNAKLATDRANVEEAITKTKQKIAELKKKQAEAAKKEKDYALQEIQTAMQLRGSFFSEFASSIFHKTSAGLGLGSIGKNEGQMTGAQKNLYMDQHNHYNEIPKDRFETARRGRQALTSEFAGI